MGAIKKYKIIFSLFVSLGLTLIITKSFFFTGIPKINSEKIRRTIKNTKDNLTIFKNTFAYKMSSKKIDYNQVLSDFPADVPEIEFEAIPTISLILTPTLSPTLRPTESPAPTPTPTLFHSSPTITIDRPVVTIIPTIKMKPTATPTLKPKLTSKPKPTVKPQPTAKPIIDPIKITNPLDQPYYKPGLAYQCYNADKFIEIYADGLSKASCYSKVQSYVSSNLTSVSILGKSISVHKKAYPAFKAVADELSKSKVAKAYRINTIGAYVFRCNVNASTSDRNDLCSSGCVLSAHSFGIAVDINWEENCNGCSSFTMPMEIVDIFESYGFRWGGRYKSIFGSRIDPMHFEYMYDLCKDLN